MSFRPSSRLAGATAAVSLVALLCSSALATQNTKLNGPLAPELRSGSVSDYQFTADGTRVVYRANREHNLLFELFSRPLDGSGPSVKLNGPLQAGVIPSSFLIGAGDRVAYAANETGNGFELFSVPADGSASRVQLSLDGLDVDSEFQLTPAGTHVVYRESPSGPGAAFHSVPIDGSAPPLVLTPGLRVHTGWITPDETTLVFSASASGPTREILFSVPLDGSAAPVFLSETHPPGFPFLVSVFMSDVAFAPDGRVLYHEVDDFAYALYSVPLDGSQDEVLITDGPFYPGRFAVDPSALPARVAFPVNSGLTSALSDGSQPVVLSPAGWTFFESLLVVGSDVLFSAAQPGAGMLFRAPLDGSQAATALLPAGGGVGTFHLANPTEIVVTRSFAGGARQLNVVPLAGGTPLPLHPLPPAGQGPFDSLPHPDGQRVLFLGDNETAGAHELYVVPLDASSPPTKLNAPMPANAYVLQYSLTPDAAHAVYRAGPTFGGGVELFRTPLDASAPAFQLNEATPSSTILGDVESVHVTPDSGTLVYRADQESDEHFDLYALDTSAPGTPLQLSAGLPTVRPDLAFSPLNDRVVFVAQGAQHSLRAAALADGTSVELDATSAPQSFVAPWQFSTDGARVVYRRTISGANTKLLSVAVDGLSPPVVLHGPLPAGRTVSQFEISATDVVVFLSDLGQDEVFELYAVPLTGGTPVRISRPLVTGGDVTAFHVDPLGARAVFIADAVVDNRFELFSVTLDGSSRPVRLNGRLATGGDVTDFAIAPNGERVVYRADQVSDQRFDLFSVPIDGSPPAHGRPGDERRFGARRLSALSSNRAVQAGWVISPDGSQVVYRANADALQLLELFRAPLDGSSAPVQLNAPMIANGDVISFAVAPDQGRVVYLADQRLDNVNELFSVPFGGGPAVALDLMPSFGDVSSFRITPDSSDVVYLADRNTDSVPELFRAFINGGGTPMRVNLALPAGRAVQADYIPLDGGTLYRADQETNDVLELFLDRRILGAGAPRARAR